MPTIAIILVALEHLYILVLEMFLWTKPRTRKTFGIDSKTSELSKRLAMNMGLYNGFLAAGLIWSLLHPNANIAHQVQIFFLTCIIIVQGLPAIIALTAVIATAG